MFRILPCFVCAAGLLFTNACSAVEPPLVVTLKIAQGTIVLGDCLLLFVKAENTSEEMIVLDTIFDRGATEPRLEFKTGAEEFAIIPGLGQGSGNFGKGGDKIRPELPLADFFVVSPTSGRPEGDVHAFQVGGDYEVRAGVTFQKAKVYSKTLAVTVSGDAQIDWNDDAIRPTLHILLRAPYQVGPERAKIIAGLPKGSLLRNIGELGLKAHAFVESPETQREAWVEARAKSNPMIADWVSHCMIYHWATYEKRELALAEIGRLKVMTPQVLAIKYRFERDLKRKQEQREEP